MPTVGSLVLLLSQMGLLIQGSSSNCQDQPLGMEDGNIRDEMVTGFPLRQNAPPSDGRLNKNSVFCPFDPPAGSYLQIDLGKLHKVCAVATQGHEGGNNDYVKTYQVDWSTDGATWFEYKEDGVTKIFDANVNNKDVKKNPLSGLKTRYIRIRSLTWHVYPCFRAELYGRRPFPQGGNTLYSPREQDHALSGHVMNSTLTSDVISCLWECMLNAPQCKSFNYSHVTKSCELNSATKEESPGEYVKRDGFTYYAEETVEVISVQRAEVQALNIVQ